MHPCRGAVSVRRRTAWKSRARRERRGQVALSIPVGSARVPAPTAVNPEGGVEMTVLHIAHPSLEERAEHGRRAREHTPLNSHAGWRPAAERADVVTLLAEQNLTRDQD